MNTDDSIFGLMQAMKKDADEILGKADDLIQSRQDDRTLASGKIKTSTGYVDEPTCTDRSDFAPDLGSNKP